MDQRLLSFPLLCALTLPCAAQVPNGGFENWNDVGGYEDPDGWSSFNSISFPIGGVLTCEEGTPGAVGNSHVIISTQDVPGIGVVPGTLYSTGDILGPSGFPYAVRSGALNGQWYYDILSADQAFVTVTMSRWNTGTQQRDVIGVGVASATGSLANWDAFSAPITYIAPGDPDTAVIYIYSSVGDGAAGSNIHVDDLAFGAATGITDLHDASVFELFPSPATDVLNIRTPGSASAVTILDARGREVRRAMTVSPVTVIDLTGLLVGTYVAQIRLEDGRSAFRTFVKD